MLSVDERHLPRHSNLRQASYPYKEGAGDHMSAKGTNTASFDDGQKGQGWAPHICRCQSFGLNRELCVLSQHTVLLASNTVSFDDGQKSMPGTLLSP